jgi:hypothetical protein
VPFKSVLLSISKSSHPVFDEPEPSSDTGVFSEPIFSAISRR